MTLVLYFQVDDVKGELLERYKVLPALNSRLSELENQNDELREKNRQMEQKLATMQVILVHTSLMFSKLSNNVSRECPILFPENYTVSNKSLIKP